VSLCFSCRSSRSFINDSPVNLPVLQELSDFLIDIHSQQQTRELSKTFSIIDAIAGNSDSIQHYATLLKSYKVR
jgi:DNA repair protein RecN (Recombination protein N)